MDKPVINYYMTNTEEANKKNTTTIKDETEKLLINKNNIFQRQQINSMRISMNIKRQAMKLLRKLSIQQANINNKPSIHSNQSQTTL